MKGLVKFFVYGLITLLPISLTVFIVTQVLQWIDTLIEDVLNRPLPVPGLGILLALVGITLVGYLASNWVGQRLVNLIDRVVRRIPLIRLVHTLIKDTIESLLGERKSFQQVAIVRIPGTSMKLVGFVTAKEIRELGDVGKDHVAVYILQSMQWAGHTVLVPKEDVEIVDIPVEAALKFVVSAGISSK